MAMTNNTTFTISREDVLVGKATRRLIIQNVLKGTEVYTLASQSVEQKQWIYQSQTTFTSSDWGGNMSTFLNEFSELY